MDGAVPEQIVVVAGVTVTTGVGLTVIRNVLAVPEQLVAVDSEGVTVIVDVIGAVPELAAVNEGIPPVPLVAVSPIKGLLFVQAKLVPAIPPANVIGVVVLFLQYVTSSGCVTEGAGFTVTTTPTVAPGQFTLLFE